MYENLTMKCFGKCVENDEVKKLLVCIHPSDLFWEHDCIQSYSADYVAGEEYSAWHITAGDKLSEVPPGVRQAPSKPGVTVYLVRNDLSNIKEVHQAHLCLALFNLPVGSLFTLDDVCYRITERIIRVHYPHRAELCVCVTQD